MVVNTSPGYILHRSLDVKDRLANLGLDQDRLWNALRAGSHFKASLTEFNTAAIRGIGLWDAIIRSLSEEFRPLGWTKKEPGNFATIVHPGGQWCVAVLSGDKGTGQRHIPLSNRHSFGGTVRKRTRKAVNDNLVAVGHQGHFSVDPSAWRQPPPMLTYFLVHFIDPDNGSVRAELSLPTYLPDAFITVWHERIILPTPADLSATVDFARPPASPPGDDIDIQITDKVP